MKILFLTNQLDTGGIETNLVLLSRQLVARGHDVLVAARPGVLTGRIAEAGARFTPLEVRPSVGGARRRDVRKLRGIVSNERPDIVHVFSASCGFLLRLARGIEGRSSSSAFLASIMGLQNQPDESRLRIHARNWMTTLGAQRVLLPSPAIERLVRKLPVRRRRLAFQVVQGVETWNGTTPAKDETRAAREELGVPPSADLVVTIGRLNASKSHELFIDAAAVVLRKRPDVHFLIVGEGELRGTLQEHIDALQISGNVRLVGERHDVPRILAGSAVCVRPGVVEGFVGITALEAQALGVPVVAFETEDVKMAIQDGETGLLVPPSDSEAMGIAILRLLEDWALAAMIGAAGRGSLEANFAIDSIVDRLEERYIAEVAAAKA